MKIEGLRKMMLIRMAEKDMRQKDVAAQFGVSDRKMSSIMNTDEIHSPEDLFAIADFLGKSVDELAGREEEENLNQNTES